jgi:hypothetical protein
MPVLYANLRHNYLSSKFSNKPVGKSNASLYFIFK